jgi:hypothetical protein
VGYIRRRGCDPRRVHIDKLLVILIAVAAGAVSGCAGDSDSADSGAAAPVSAAGSAASIARRPAPGSCRATGSGKFSEPDPHCTPGALNPGVTQATIDQTICVRGWSARVRPPASVTDREKIASMAKYRDIGPPSDYEYDHLVSLELGGASNDARNLWPEPVRSPNPKDAVENELHRLVCGRQMSLARARRIIATDWVGWARRVAVARRRLGEHPHRV